MASITIEDAQRRYGGATESELLQNMARIDGCYRIYKYANGNKGPNTYTDYKRISRQKEEDGLFDSPWVHNPTLVYDRGQILNIEVPAEERRKDATDGVVRFRCPQCQKPVKAPVAFAEKHAKCPFCHARVLVPDPKAQDKSNNPEIPVHNEGSSERASDGPVSLFFFDTYAISTAFWGRHIFTQIVKALSGSRGVCVFHDGKVPEDAPAELIRRAREKKGRVVAFAESTTDNPLSRENSQWNSLSLPVVVSIWTHTQENRDRIHDWFAKNSPEGYLGFITYSDAVSRHAWDVVMQTELSCPSNMTVEDGQVTENNVYDVYDV